MPATEVQHGPGHREQSKHVDVKLPANLVFLAFLSCGLVAIASIVDQHIDTAEVAFSGSNSGSDLASVSDVEIKRQSPVTGIAHKLDYTSLVARGHGDPPAFGQYGPNQLFAETT